MPRYKLLIEYDGTNYAGWQRQTNAPSIQEEIEKSIYKFCGETVNVYGSGRTDSGVHASGQVAHIDLATPKNLIRIQGAINFYLKPNKIGILSVEEVDDDFHARFSAVKRYYTYRVLNRNARPVLDESRVYHVRGNIDIEKMREGAEYLLGTHDFSSFRAQECQALSPVKTLDSIDIVVDGENIQFNLAARSFLHHMVRNIVGTLIHVGIGKWEPIRVKEILEARDRSLAGPTAPSAGLYLTKIDY